MSDKMLDLTDVKTEDFEAIKNAVENWKLDGMVGTFGYITEENVQEMTVVLKDAFKKVYTKGVWHGGLALLGGFAIGSVICKTVEHFTTKKDKDE